MSRFGVLAHMGFKTGLAYRAHFFVGLLRVPVSLIIYYYVWKSIFAYSGVDLIRGYTFSDLLGYYVLSMMVGIITYCEVDDWMSQDIRSGIIVTDFLRPMKYIWNLFSIVFGMRSLSFIIELIPTIIIGIFIIGVPIPTLIYFLLFLASLIMAFFLNYFLAFSLGLTAFWFKEIHGLIKVKNTLMAFLEGSLIPLTFFPLFFQGIFKYLPFQYLRFTPINIFLGKYPVSEVLVLLTIQIIWTLLFYFIATFMFKQAFKKFAGEGV